MNRRQFLAAASCAAAWSRRAECAAAPPDEGADITLRIGEMALDLGPKRTVRTLAYNGQVPGPLLRARQGQRLTIDVVNETNARDIVHWHGFHIPSEVDGAYDEGTPGVPPHGRQRYQFVASPAGTRWYHSHEIP